MLTFVIDFEGSLKCGVAEFGVVVLDDDRIVEVETGLCAPDIPLTPRDIQVCGLKNEWLEEQPSFEKYQAKFYKYRKLGVLAAHHAPVENGFLSRYWNTVPTKVDSDNPYVGDGSWGPWVDSRIIYQRHYKLSDYSLMSLVKTFQLQEQLDQLAEKYCSPERSKPHCALYDTLASALLLVFTTEQIGLTPEDWVRDSVPLAAEDPQQETLF